MTTVIDGTLGLTTPTYGGNVTAEYTVPVTAFKNRIINGQMQIDQRNAGASVTPTTNAYTLDRWNARLSVASKYSVQQNAGSVTPPVGFANYLGVTSLSSYSVGGSDYFGLSQAIEGYNTADLGWGTANASSVTLSFWVRSSLTGTFGGSVYNSTSSRSYVFSYTISSANTWEQKTITIAGDTTGTWLTNSGSGIVVWFSVGAGSTYTGAANTWSSSWYAQPTGATSVVGTNGATFYITGVQLEKGSTATSFDYRPYGTELQLCQRYFVAMGGTAYERFAFGGWWANTTTGFPVCPLPVPVRNPSAVSITYDSLSSFTTNNPGGTPSSIAVDWMGKNTLLSLNVQVSSGATAQTALLLYDNGGGNARFYVNCEL